MNLDLLKMYSRKPIVWDHFNKIVGDKNKFSCKYCLAKYSKHATRLAEHLLKCEKCPPDVKRTYLIFRFGRNPSKTKEVSETLNVTIPSVQEEEEAMEVQMAPSAESPPLQSPTPSTSSINSWNTWNMIGPVTPTEKARLDSLLARAIYSSGSPLSITDNPHWVEFFKAMRPTYTLPSKHQLCNTLLDKEFEEMKKEVDTKLNAPSLGLQCNTWTNIRNQVMSNYIITTPNPVLYRTTTTDVDQHTGEHIANELSNIIESIWPHEIFGIATDNTPEMLSARSIIREKYKHINTYSCVTDVLHLLIQDLLSITTFNTMESSCKELVKDINRSHVNLATFNRIQTEEVGSLISLKLPVKNRWGSILTCLESVQSCKTALQLLAIDDTVTLKQSVKKNCLDEDHFWPTIDTLVQLLKPIVKWITVFEGSGFFLGHVVVCFKEIEKLFDSNVIIIKEERKSMRLQFEERKLMVLTPLHYAAHLLDPKFCGMDLTNEQHVEAMKFLFNIIELHAQFLNRQEIIVVELPQYVAKTGLWEEEFVWVNAKSIDPCTWWNGMCKTTELKAVAIAILGLPASSSSMERSFSGNTCLRNAKRSGLTVERASKLVYIAYNMKLLKSSGNSKQNVVLDDAEDEFFADCDIDVDPLE